MVNYFETLSCSQLSFFMGAQEEEPHLAIEDSLILIFTASFYLIRLFCECYAKLLATLHLIFFFFNQKIFPSFSEVQEKVHPMLAWWKTRHGTSLMILKS